MIITVFVLLVLLLHLCHQSTKVHLPLGFLLLKGGFLGLYPAVLCAYSRLWSEDHKEFRV